MNNFYNLVSWKVLHDAYEELRVAGVNCYVLQSQNPILPEDHHILLTAIHPTLGANEVRTLCFSYTKRCN